MAASSALRSLFSSLSLGSSSSLKGKARKFDCSFGTPPAQQLRWLGTTRSQPRATASTAEANSLSASTSVTPQSAYVPTASLSSGPLPREPVQDTSEALRLLRTQPNHYVIASIAGRTYVLAPRDLLTVPKLRDVKVGDVIELDRIHEVGSRDYTLRAQNSLNTRRQKSALASSWAAQLAPSGLAHVGSVLGPQAVKVRCVVAEHTKGNMERILKKKRRKGYRKTITHKQPYTRLRVESIELGK
ncbi:hypothetical protein IE53DRAFT_187043 [Violaceomyces palustris]|uniref:Uncharacterized protein n=1 Tax=Violaceomyces palustris TaxID=1673888 RepID=A0ACD0NRW4_9BASI|nr:hypothetical protein IE53DRAFT_187043 [Violaceomyces palustris]